MPIADLRALLLDWYRRVRRDLPWRRDRDPYRVWLSEVMLQQTRVDVVLPYFERFLGRFPTLLDLAAASEDEVLALWSGLGYYSRGRRLHQAARAIAERHGGLFPARRDDLRALPGIGDYTAGAVLSIAFGQREAAVDGNVRRVVSRLFALRADPARGEGAQLLHGLVEGLVPSTAPGDFNQALMELGATVCTPRGPRCGICPVSGLCHGYRLQAPESFPAAAAKARTESWIHVAALLRDSDGRVLLVRRADEEPLLPGLWHLPGLFLPVSAAADAVERLAASLAETFAIPLEVGQLLSEARHQITFRKIRAFAYEVRSSASVDSLAAKGRWTADPGLDGLPTSSLLGKLLANDASGRERRERTSNPKKATTAARRRGSSSP